MELKLKKIVLLIFILAVIVSILPVFAQSSTSIESPIVIKSTRSTALGGTHVALADDLTSLFSNPAGFKSAGPELSIAGITMGLAGPIFDMASVIIESSSGGNPQDILLSSNVQDMLKSLYASMELVGPLAFGYVGQGLGFGFFSNSNIVFSSSGTVPTIAADVDEDFLFAGGYAFRIPLPASWKSTLDFGAMLKAFVRGSLSISSSMIDLISLLQSPNMDIIYNQPFKLGIGVGLDAGILYSWEKMVSFGIVGRNLYAPTLENNYSTFNSFVNSETPTESFGIVPIDLSAGVMFSPYLGAVEHYISGLKIFLDYSDILDFLTHPATASNPVLHVGFGTEIVLLEILSIRAGFNEGLFSAGLGIDLSLVSISLSMFGSELSPEPGLRPVYNLLIGIDFSI
ncbi:MAG: hypothetical protein DRP57_09870 [Spirochaetes bacterium]|nr:MAG: hypothetical protein DRP57_09870 [Spirochaetota bacterium]